MHEPIEDGVRHRRFTEPLVPVLDRQLTAHHRRAPALSVLQYFQYVSTLCLRQRSQSLVIQNQHIVSQQSSQQTSVRAIGVRQLQILQQSREPHILHAESLSTRLFSQRARQECLASSRRSGDQHGQILLDILTRPELRQLRP